MEMVGKGGSGHKRGGRVALVQEQLEASTVYYKMVCTVYIYRNHTIKLQASPVNK
jgi:hypothetical protein